MSIRKKKDGVWEVRVYIGMDGAKSKFSYATVYGTKRDAEEAEVKIKAAKIRGRVNLSAFNLTVDEFLTIWLRDYVEPYKAASTVENYKYNFKRLLPHIGHLQIRKLSPSNIQSGYTKIGKTLSPSTVRDTHRVLHAALECAVKNEYISNNVSDKVELPHAPRFAPQILTEVQATKLLEAAKGSQHYELVAIALLTGMRLGELASLKWKDIDLGAATLEVQKSKTKAGYRTVHLDLKAVAVLEELHSKRKPLIDDFVFLGKTGKRIYEKSISKEYLRRITEKAGLPKMRFHDLRHTHATWLTSANISARTVADRLGHVDPSFTLRTYAHASIDAQRQAAAIAGAMLRLPGDSQDGQ